ncbi:hypothetical protein RJP21_04675 [Paenibacillus sp. VCA1]|uniref:hypothetical protein n=1 Tax=Paenibacillus sp. VCA1 TaxID=3039148 RepID=UPI002871B4D6|nr:hypothetical protein [Paenibacillus sp. VCA1]MDR9852895.1 hypothetical protein [Paenibacillus sp. VCA1]
MARNSVTFDFNIITKALDRTKAEVQASGVVGVQDAVDDLLATSRDEAPLDEGTLRMTAFNEVSADGEEVVGTVTFSAVNQSESGERYNYALRLHEMGSFKNPTTAGTKPKYLERPLKANAKRYNRMIADAIRKGLR